MKGGTSMLIMFRVKNFMSFKDEVVLDFRKTSLREHAHHTFKLNQEVELLKSIAIYGANASGKSNLMYALSAFIETMQKQFFDHEDEDNSNQKTVFSYQPFSFSNKINPIMEFEIAFGYQDVIYQYALSVDQDRKVHYERLDVNYVMLFERSETIKFHSDYDETLSVFSKVRKDRTLLAMLDFYALDEQIKNHIDAIKTYFNDYMKVHLEVYFESSIKGFFSAFRIHDKAISQNPELMKKVSEFTEKIDVGIEGLELQKIERKNAKTKEVEESYEIKVKHAVFDETGKKAKTISLSLDQESRGTVRFISFIRRIVDILESGGVYIVDEISSSFHPLLTKFIVDLFHSNLNRHNAQLIFTTHETTLMNKEQFRRDQIYLIEKNHYGASSLFSLADLKVRSDATFGSDYFKGKYGAIPVVQSWFAEANS